MARKKKSQLDELEELDQIYTSLTGRQPGKKKRSRLLTLILLLLLLLVIGLAAYAIYNGSVSEILLAIGRLFQSGN